MSQPPPEWWAQRKGPRIGCADVTIVSLASITAFVVLLLILGRSDFILEKLPGATNNPTIIAGKSNDPTEAAIKPAITRTAAPTPSPSEVSPTLTPSIIPSPTPKLASIKISCNIRADATTREKVLKVLKVGTVVKQLGPTKANEGVTWYNIELNDESGIRGWMQDICF